MDLALALIYFSLALSFVGLMINAAIRLATKEEEKPRLKLIKGGKYHDKK